MTTLDEATLLAYVDGKLDAATAQAVETALAGDPQARLMVEKLRTTPTTLREVFDATLVRPLSPRFAQTVLRSKVGAGPRTQVRLRHALAAAVAVFLIGAGVGFFSGAHQAGRLLLQSEQSWIAAVVDYQVLYGRETLSHPTATADEIRQYEQRFSRRLGHELNVPDLKALGFVFKRGQLLEFNGEPIVQLAYLPTTGKPVAYCVMRNAGADSSPALGHAKGLAFYHWRKGGYGHIVVGPVTESQLQQLLSVIRGEGRSTQRDHHGKTL